MDVERHLISSIVANKDLGPVAEASITTKFFEDQKSRAVFQTIIEHSSRYGGVPSLSSLTMDFPDYRFVKPEDSIDYLIDEVRKRHKLALIEEGLAASAEAYDDGDPEVVLRIISDIMSKVATAVPSTRDTNITQTTEERLEEYVALKEGDGGLLGIPTGFATLDKATQGLQPEQLVTLVGPPKAGKSTLMLLMALAAWASGERPLMFTFEMSTKEMTQRLDAFRAGISHARLRTGNLKKDEWQRLEKALHAMESMPDFWFSADSSNATNLSGIAAKIDKIKPTVVFVDGIYLLNDEVTGEVNTPQALTNLTRGFKRMAQNREVPVVISTQVLEWKMDKKKGVTSNSIGYSSSFAQDSDTIIGVEKTEDEIIQKIKVVLARNCPPLETFVQWNWEMGTFEELETDPFATEGGGWNDSEGSAF